MPRKITITAGKVRLPAMLNDSPSAEAVWAALPIEARATRWGEEIYFEIDVPLEESDDARVEMQVGDLAYWPPGSAFCIFFGPTPVSRGAEPRAYSPVNVLGRVDGDATRFRAVVQGAPVRLARADTA
jgi:hypothetical protein